VGLPCRFRAAPFVVLVSARRAEEVAMPKLSWTVSVRRPPEEVFAYLADFDRHAEWSPKPFRIEAKTDGPVGVGSKFHSTGWIPGDSKHENDVEVTECASPSRLAWSSYEGGQTFTNVFVLSPQDGGTRVERTLDMPKPSGVVGVVFPLVSRFVVKPGVQKGLDMFKANLERGTG
jgi:uncharacterized protein YndB with AHSA1/START domain